LEDGWYPRPSPPSARRATVTVVNGLPDRCSTPASVGNGACRRSIRSSDRSQGLDAGRLRRRSASWSAVLRRNWSDSALLPVLAVFAPAVGRKVGAWFVLAMTSVMTAHASPSNLAVRLHTCGDPCDLLQAPSVRQRGNRAGSGVTLPIGVMPSMKGGRGGTERLLHAAARRIEATLRGERVAVANGVGSRPALEVRLSPLVARARLNAREPNRRYAMATQYSGVMTGCPTCSPEIMNVARPLASSGTGAPVPSLSFAERHAASSTGTPADVSDGR